MKILLTILLCFYFFNVRAQEHKILFAYDNAGNQTSRTICLNCTNAGKSEQVITEITKLKPQDLQKFSPDDQISYYPNPVKEELYLKWELIDGNKVAEIQIYSLTGQLVGSYNKLENTNEKILYFQQYPQGMYDVL